MDSEITIIPAQVRHAPGMVDLINDSAEQGRMLHRALSEMYERLRDFQVAVTGPDQRVLGTVGLRIMWANLAEIYSLVVSPEARGQGLGRRMVLSAVDTAEQLGIRKVFALTYERSFFERCGFSVVDRDRLPLKVWSECVRCPKNLACDEIAMVRVMEEVPDLAPPVPQQIELRYRVPVLSETMLRRRDAESDSASPADAKR